MSLLHVNDSIPDYIALTCAQNISGQCKPTEDVRNIVDNFGKSFNTTKTPKILIMSLEAMYKTIQDTYETNPIVCCKFLQSILTYLESLQPGDWVNECEEIIDYLFKLLLGITQSIDIQTSRVINRSRSMTNSLHRSVKLIDTSLSYSDDCFQSFQHQSTTQNKLCNIATSCLFSIGIAKGSINMIMAATNAVLIRNGLMDDNETMQVPSLVLKLKNLSDVTYKISENSHSGQFPLLKTWPENVNSGCLLSNGTYLFWLTSVGILKIGTGFNGSIKGFVYHCNEEMAKHWNGWMGLVSNSILFHTSGSVRSFKMNDTIHFYKINTEQLQIDGQITLKIDNFADYTNAFSWQCYFFTNFHRFGCCVIKDDENGSERLYLKMFRQSDKQLIEETEKVIDLTQHLMWKIGIEKPKATFGAALLIDTTNQMTLVLEAMNLEEFCIVRTLSGELYYKDLGNKESNNNPENWNQLIYNNCSETKFDKLIGGIENKFICAISDDGLWRISCNKHSQPHSLFLHRLMSNSRFLSKTWIGGSCSRDNLALVSKEGQVMFLEKDSIHSISTCHGALLSPYHITQISLGKSHGACLSRNGYLITFGVNNYHQCGFANTENDGKLNEMYQEIDNNNSYTRTHVRSKVSKHQVPTIKPQKLLIYSEPNASGAIKNRSNFLRIQQVSCGFYHTVLLTVNGDVYSFGNNKFNQLGRGVISSKELPRAIPLQNKALQISTGSFSTCVLNQIGKVIIFGSKELAPTIVDLTLNFIDLSTNFQPIFLGLNLDHHKNQVIFCIAKHTMFKPKQTLTLQATKKASISHDKVLQFAKNNILVIESLNQNNVLIDIATGLMTFMNGGEKSGVKCIDPKYPLLWSIEQTEDKTFTIKYQKDALGNEGYVSPRVDPLTDLSQDLGFSCQRYRIAMNVLVSSEKLLLERYRDLDINTDNNTKNKTSTEDFHVVKRFGKENSNWLYSPNAHDCITFSVSEPLYIHGIGLYTGGGENTMSCKIYEETSCDSDTDELMVTNILNCDQQPSTLVVLSETERTDVQNSDSRKIVKLLLDSPIMLFPNKYYVVVAIITGDSTDFGFQGRSKVETDLGITFKFKSSRNSSNGTHVKEGQIPEIYYSLKLSESKNQTCDPDKTMSLINAASMAEYLTNQISTNSLSSSVALLNWIYTGLTCLFSELPDLQEDNQQQTYSLKLLKSIDTLKLYTRAFVSSLRIIRKHIQHLYPYHGLSKDLENQETSVIIGDFRIIIRNIFLECKICNYLSSIKLSFGPTSVIFKECWSLFVNDLIPVYKETLENCYYTFYPEIEDQRSTLQDSLMKVYEICVNKMADTLCNYGKIAYLESLLSALNTINDHTVFLTINNTSISTSKPEFRITTNFSDRFPLLRDYMRTIWKPINELQPDITMNISTMIHCLLTVLTLDSSKIYKPCRHSLESNRSGNDAEERQLYRDGMTSLINASNTTLKNITNILIDHMNLLGKEVGNTASDNQSNNSKTNSKYNDPNHHGLGPADTVQTTQSRFRQVFWLDSQENIENEQRKDTCKKDFRELMDVISFDVTKYSYQFINGYEVAADSAIYLEGIKVYCSNQKESQCSAYVYRRNKYPDGTKEELQLIPTNYEWKREEYELTAYNLMFTKKIKLEEWCHYTVKVYLKIPRHEKVIMGQHAASKLEAKSGFCFNLSDGGPGSLCTSGNKHGIISSLIYSVNNGIISTIDNRGLERKITKICILEFIAHVKFTLIATVKDVTEDKILTVGQQIFLKGFLPFFCQKISLIAEASKQIACQSISLVRESLPTIQDYLKSTDYCSLSNKDYFVIAESTHPYEPAKFLQKIITLPLPVEVISINFDNQCVTSQPEDFLTIKVRSNRGSDKDWKVLCKSLSHVAAEWPKKPIVCIGNEISVEFHSSTLYEESLLPSYGYRCTITGHIERQNNYAELVENSLAFLASKCAASLLEYRYNSKTIKLINESRILEKSSIYRSILDRGLSLSKLPTLTDCLNKSPLEYVNSMQTNFIKKFVQGLNSMSEKSGSSPSVQLAKWLQSCSVVVVNKCKIRMNPASTPGNAVDQDPLDISNVVGRKVYCDLGQELHFQLELIDQYDSTVSCHKSSVDIAIHYVHKGINTSTDINDKMFGCHVVPNTTIPYEKSVVGKDVYHSISMMKNYEMYSFEEIRFAGVQENVCKIENLKCKWSEQEGLFKFSWTPRSCGQFNLVVSIDQFVLIGHSVETNSTTIIDVTRNSSTCPPREHLKKLAPDRIEKSKYLWFEGKQSSGLRLRFQPSFYSPVLGIIPCQTIIKFEEELYTENSTWVKLHQDSFQQWYGYYTVDPLEQQLAISMDTNYMTQDVNSLRKKTALKTQLHSSALCKKTLKSNLKPYTEGWCLKEHMKKIFLSAAKFNYSNQSMPKETVVKFASHKFGFVGAYDNASKTLPTQRRSSVRSLQNKVVNNNNNALSLPNSPELALKRKTGNIKTTSSSASTSQQTSPVTMRRRSSKNSLNQGNTSAALTEAMSPFQAKTQRALFAAICWQNGLISDLIQVAESINMYSAYQNLEKQVNNSNQIDENKNNNTIQETFGHLSGEIPRSNSQNTGDLSVLSDSDGMKNLAFPSAPRVIPTLADLVANAVAATSNPAVNEKSDNTPNSPPSPVAHIKRSQSNMDERSTLISQPKSMSHRGKHFVQFGHFKEEARKLGLHVSLDEELLNISKPSSSSNNRINESLQNEITAKLNQLTKLWDTIAAILSLYEEQCQFNKTDDITEKIKEIFATSVMEETSYAKQGTLSFYQKVFENSMLLLELKPIVPLKFGFLFNARDHNVSSKIVDTSRVLSPNNDEESRARSKANYEHSYSIPHSTRTHNDVESVIISKSNKLKLTSFPPLFTEIWPLHNLQKGLTNKINQNDAAMAMAFDGEDSSTYLACDCWSCLPLLKQSDCQVKANYSSGNITEMSLPNSSFGTTYGGSAFKHFLMKMNRPSQSTWDHTFITSSDSNSTSVRPQMGSTLSPNTSTLLGQLLHSMMTLLVNTIASSSSGVEIFDRSVMQSNSDKKDVHSQGLLEMRFCLCNTHLTELRLAFQEYLQAGTIEQYCYQTYFWMMESMRHSSSQEIVMWCLYNILHSKKSHAHDADQTERAIEDNRLKTCYQQLWAIGCTIFYRMLDDIIHSSGLASLKMSDIKLLEIMIKLSNLLLFSDGSGDSTSQLFMSFEKSQVFYCLSEVLNQLDDLQLPSRKNETLTDASITQSPTEITKWFSCDVSSNHDTAPSLLDDTTDMFWESAGLPVDQYPTITLKLNHNSKNSVATDHIIVAIYIDRVRDVVNGQLSAAVRLQRTNVYEQIIIPSDHVGWIDFNLKKDGQLEYPITIGFQFVPYDEIHNSAVNGVINDKIRVRLVKVFDASKVSSLTYFYDRDRLRLRFELIKDETLKAFISMTNHIFQNCFTSSYQNKIEKVDQTENTEEETKSLHDFLVNVLFDTGFKSDTISSRLNGLQRRVLAHIISQINIEVSKILNYKQRDPFSCNDTTYDQIYDQHRCSCCFQLLNQVLALSEAQAGLRFLVHQAQLIRDLIVLLYIGSEKIRIQVIFTITRIFSALNPRSLEDVLYGILLGTDNDPLAITKTSLDKTFLPLNILILFAGKSLNIQMKSKLTLTLGLGRGFNDSLKRIRNLPPYMQSSDGDSGSANKIYQLICQLSDENNHTAWYIYIQEWLRDIFENFVNIDHNLDLVNVETLDLYLLICTVPIFQSPKLSHFWNNLSSTARVLKSGDKNICTNHDDGTTLATIICYTCQSIHANDSASDLSLQSRLVFLCAECDRYLHLSKMTKYHIRDAITACRASLGSAGSPQDCLVNSQQSCVRLKSNKFTVTLDLATLKILINVTQTNSGQVEEETKGELCPDKRGVCRFCSETMAVKTTKMVCESVDCQMKSRFACVDIRQSCGHFCLGVSFRDNLSLDKKICPSICLDPRCSSPALLSANGLKQDGDDVCMICFTDTLVEAPIIILENCHHILHFHCVRHQIEAGWPGYRVTFNFRRCPFCKLKMEHEALRDLLEPINALETEVKRKALLRLEHEGLMHSPESKDLEGLYKDDPEEFALHRYCYYLCFKCKNPYYGGEGRCDPEIGPSVGDQTEKSDSKPVIDPATELCCAACSDVAQAKVCPKHSTDFLEYKCRYCCSVAVFFCFGTTHFCQRCHDNLDVVLKAQWVPPCPAGPALQQLSGSECPLHVIHPPTGEEYALGCALCRKLDTF